MEQRQAPDGYWYTQKQFRAYFGRKAAVQWREAGAKTQRNPDADTPPVELVVATQGTGADTPSKEPRTDCAPHTFEGLHARGPQRPGCGARHAWQVQRALRTWCLTQKPVVYFVDLTSNKLPLGAPTISISTGETC